MHSVAELRPGAFDCEVRKVQLASKTSHLRVFDMRVFKLVPLDYFKRVGLSSHNPCLGFKGATEA